MRANAAAIVSRNSAGRRRRSAQGEPASPGRVFHASVSAKPVLPITRRFTAPALSPTKKPADDDAT